jgi:uncharacterized membrane protein YdjX (TVP38/TMEM64 family)
MRSTKKMKIFILSLMAIFFASLHYLCPGFYSTLWKLASCGDVQGTIDFLKSFGSSAMLVSFLVLVAFNAVGFLPNFFLLAANGMLFGIVGGTAISWAGECVGGVIGFYLMRTTIREYALSAIDRAGYLCQVNEFSSHKGFRAVFLTRALPYIPSGLVTAASAISCIGFKDFFWATVLGKLPSALIEVMFGHDLVDYKNHINRLVLLASLITATYVSIWWYKRKRGIESIATSRNIE